MVDKKVKEFPFVIGQLEEALEEREHSDRRNSHAEIETERRKQDRRKEEA